VAARLSAFGIDFSDIRMLQKLHLKRHLKLKTMSTTTETDRKQDHKVADISLADFGRKEIGIAEKEMPGLMAIR